MYKVYLFEKKIFILFKICKFIYDFMVFGNLGKFYGVDDFLFVFMYVLVCSNFMEMFFNVEYMMEFMDFVL